MQVYCSMQIKKVRRQGERITAGGSAGSKVCEIDIVGWFCNVRYVKSNFSRLGCSQSEVASMFSANPNRAVDSGSA